MLQTGQSEQELGRADFVRYSVGRRDVASKNGRLRDLWSRHPRHAFLRVQYEPPFTRIHRPEKLQESERHSSYVSCAHEGLICRVIGRERNCVDLVAKLAQQNEKRHNVTWVEKACAGRKNFYLWSVIGMILMSSHHLC
jgi:hypothetical protein